MTRKQASLLVQLSSGHVPLNKQLNRIGKAKSPKCQASQTSDEMVHHFLLMVPEVRSPEGTARRKSTNEPLGQSAFCGKPACVSVYI